MQRLIGTHLLAILHQNVFQRQTDADTTHIHIYYAGGIKSIIAASLSNNEAQLYLALDAQHYQEYSGCQNWRAIISSSSCNNRLVTEKTCVRQTSSSISGAMAFEKTKPQYQHRPLACSAGDDMEIIMVKYVELAWGK